MLRVHHSTGYAKNDGRGGIVSQSEINALFRVSSNSLAGCSCLRLPQVQGDYTLQADGTGALVQLTLVNDILGTIQSAWTAVAAGVVHIALMDGVEAFFYFENAVTTVAGAMEVSVVTEWFGPIGGAFSPITDRANGAVRYASFYVTSDVSDTVELSANGFDLYDAGDGAYNAAADDPGSVSWAAVISDVPLTAGVPRMFWARHTYNAADVGITETALYVSGESGLALLSGIRIAEDGQSGYKVYHATSGTTGGTLLEGTGAEFAIIGNQSTEPLYSGEFNVYSAANGDVVRVVDDTGYFGGTGSDARSVAFSGDGSLIAVSSGKPTDTYYSSLYAYPGGGAVSSVFNSQVANHTAVSPDGLAFACATPPLYVDVWKCDAGVGGYNSAFQCQTDPATSYPIYYCEFSKDGTMLCAAFGATGKAEIYAVSDGARLHSFYFASPVNSASFSPDGTSLVVAYQDDNARVWDIATETVTLTLTGHAGDIRRAYFSPDGTMIATCSQDNTVKIWNAATGAVIDTLTDANAPVRDVAWSPAGDVFVSGSNNGNAYVYDTATWTLQHTVAHGYEDLRSIAFDPSKTDTISFKTLPIRIPLPLPGSGTETHLYRVTYRNKYGVESPNQWLQYNIELDENGDLTAPPAPASLFLTLNPNGTISVTAVSGAFRQESIEDYRWIVSDGTITQSRTITPRPGFAETYQEVWGPFDWDDEITISVAIQDGRSRTSDALTETVTITSTSPSIPAQYAMTGLENGKYIALIDPYQDGDNWLDGGFGTAALYADGEKVLEVNVLEDGEVINLHDYALVNDTVTGAGDAPFVVDGDSVYLCADGARIVEINTVARTITAAQIVNDSTLSCPVAATYTEDSEGNVYFQAFSPISNTWATWMRVDVDGTLRLGFGIKQDEEVGI